MTSKSARAFHKPSGTHRCHAHAAHRRRPAWAAGRAWC